jgi:hypothetical protein
MPARGGSNTLLNGNQFALISIVRPASGQRERPCNPAAANSRAISLRPSLKCARPSKWMGTLAALRECARRFYSLASSHRQMEIAVQSSNR